MNASDSATASTVAQLGSMMIFIRSQIRRIADRLEEFDHREVVVTREPGGTQIGEDIRHLIMHKEINEAMCPETELLLFAASRAQLVREVIYPAIEEGKIVLCDRFLDSTTVSLPT